MRFEQADAVAHAAETTTAGAARGRRIARRTLRGWRLRKIVRHDAPGLSAFAESPEGVRALHRIVLAALLVFGVMHGAGAGTIRRFLLLASLSDWIACSESTLRRTQARVVEAIGSWGDDTLQRLGRTMPRRELTLVARTLAAEGLSEGPHGVVREILIPLRYLESVQGRASQAAERHRLDEVLGALRARLASATEWSTLPQLTRHWLESTAVWLASHFVRASSAVEGHKGFLSLRYHQRRALPPALLKALMVIHNYVLQREDGTTAAERFFGRRHDDLFEHLIEVVAPLPRPRRSRA